VSVSREKISGVAGFFPLYSSFFCISILNFMSPTKPTTYVLPSKYSLRSKVTFIHTRVFCLLQLQNVVLVLMMHIYTWFGTWWLVVQVLLRSPDICGGPGCYFGHIPCPGREPHPQHAGVRRERAQRRRLHRHDKVSTHVITLEVLARTLARSIWKEYSDGSYDRSFCGFMAILSWPQILKLVHSGHGY